MLLSGVSRANAKYVCSNVWDCVETTWCARLLACRLKIISSANPKLIISFLELLILVLSSWSCYHLLPQLGTLHLTLHVYLRLANRPSANTAAATTIAQRHCPQCSHCSGYCHHPPLQHCNQTAMVWVMATEAMAMATRVVGKQWQDWQWRRQQNKWWRRQRGGRWQRGQWQERQEQWWWWQHHTPSYGLV
jgi:hypothetical protein